MNQLSFVTRRGKEISTEFDELASLRITVFRAYPYLYEGSIAYEKDYLHTYTQSERSLLFAVYHHTRMVGATTCVPLSEETEEIQRPFKEAGLDIDSFFYFGESILLPKFRGMGLGHRFFDEREAHARSFGTYLKSCFFSVEREENHPAMPEGYRSNEAFWIKRGYVKEEALHATLEWPDIGEEDSSPKSLICWMKNL